MTTVRDFEGNRHSRGRAPTITTLHTDESERPHSPPTTDNPGRDRRGSLTSHLSVSESVRNRKPSRSNTVHTYPPHYQEEVQHEFFTPGAEPGIDTAAADEKIPFHVTNLKEACDINIIDFSDTDVRHVRADNDSLSEFLDAARNEDLPCRWISVNGLSWDVIRVLGNKYGLHRLAIEDLTHTKTRTKVDWYADQVFIVLTLQKLVRLHLHKGSDDKCDCNAMTDSESDGDLDEKQPDWGPHKRKWWDFRKKKMPDTLPRYNSQAKNMDEFVTAHSNTSNNSPIKRIRTLHRYESAQIPQHTAWMERHSALMEDNLAVGVEQVSMFLLADNCVISFFENSAEDVEEPLLKRLDSEETMLRRSCDASLLTQAIIDAIVDLAVPVKDAYNKCRKELQIDAMTNPNIRTSRALHIFGEEVDMLQNLFKPIVHLVNALRDHNNEPVTTHTPPSSTPPPDYAPRPKPNRDRQGMANNQRKLSDFRRITKTRADNSLSVTISPLAHTYFGDVLDHCITIISALEQMDASANNISTLIFNTVGAKTNNFMMILAVVTVFFAPLTFISGYFGMNFAGGKGLLHPFAFFWVVAGPALVGFMLLVFGVMLKDSIRDWLNRRGVKARWAKPGKRPSRI